MKKTPRDKSLGAQMVIALQLMKRVHHKTLAELDVNVTLEQLGVLEVLFVNGDMNMSEASKAVWKHNANITRIVDKLEKRNFVIRKPVAGDRRANMLSITKEGKHVFEAAIKIMVKTNTENLSCLSSEEESLMLSLVKKIINHLT